MATPEIETIHKTFLSLLFAFFLVTSHYGGAYLFGFALITVVGLKIFWQVLNQLKPHLLNRPTTTLVTSPFVLFYIVANLAWYMYTVSGKGHTLLVRFSRHVILNLTEFMDPDVSYTTHALQKNWASDTIQLMKYGYIIMWVFISFGLVYEILKHTNIQKIAISQVKNNKTPSFHPEYLIFSIAFMGIFSTTLLPTRSFNAPRIMITVLVLLAPFFVSGIRLLMKSIGIISRKGINAKRYTHTIVVLFLVAFFLVNTGFVTETVTKDYGPSVIFGKERIDDSDEIREKAYLYKQAFKSTTDLRASAWLIDNGDSDATIYGDRFMTHRRIRIRVVYLREYGKVVLNADKPSVRQLETNATLNEGDYILLGYHNIKHEFMITQYKPRIKYFSTSKIRPLASQSNKIYTTSRSEVYRLSNRTRFQA
ncbi:MAG: DUF2206 domain-containing protein [Candidatus Paceibacteria bacterium]